MESAINYWRARTPSTGDEQSLCAEASALAEAYALMILNGRPDIDLSQLKPEARDAFQQWHGQAGA
jgi:hypothetical protein